MEIQRKTKNNLMAPLMVALMQKEEVTEQRVRSNITLALKHFAGWLALHDEEFVTESAQDISAIVIYHMQLRQWLQMRTIVTVDCHYDEDRAHRITMTAPFFERIVDEEYEELVSAVANDFPQKDCLNKSRALLKDAVLSRGHKLF